MKLDKDTFVKHQFWFLLGGYLLVWTVGVFWLMSSATAADGPIEKAKKDFESKKSGLKTAMANPVNVSKFVPPWTEQFSTFNRHKTDIWSQAWAFQSGMYDWPQDWMKNKDMYTPQTELTPSERADYWHKYYGEQIEMLRKNVPDWLKPIELAGGFDAIFAPVDPTKLELPTREECWLLQEDYWVKREILSLVYLAMYNLAKMAPAAIESEDKTPEGVVARYRFRNLNWEITLNLRKNDKGLLVIGGDSTIKNVHPTGRVQSLTSADGKGLVFNVAQDNAHTRFMVQGEPLAWNETRALSVDKDMKRVDYDMLPNIKWDEKYAKEHPIFVSQAFDATTSPIRRLSELKLDQQDSRTFYWTLQSNRELERLDAPPEDPNAKKPDNAAPNGPPGGMAGMMGGPPGGPGGPGAPGGPMTQKPGMPGMPGMPTGAESTGNLTTNNKLERNRYLHPANQDKSVNPPSRHLPFALRLIVEQTHINDLLLTLANSRLRVQITQVDFHHVKDYSPKSDNNGSDAGMGRYFMGPSAAMYGGMAGRPGMPGMPNPKGMMGGGMGMPPSPMMNNPPPTMMRPPGTGMGPMMPGMMADQPRPGDTRVSPGPPSPATKDKEGKPSAANQTDDNLVDVTIYGIATLYRRPDPPKTTDQPAAAPVTPPTQTPAAGTQPTTTPTKPPSDQTKPATDPQSKPPSDTKPTPPTDQKPKDDAGPTGRQPKANPPPPPVENR